MVFIATILRSTERHLGVIDSRKVKATCGLHLGHGETERPREGREIIENVIGEIGGVHLGDDIVVIHVRGVLEESNTVDV